MQLGSDLRSLSNSIQSRHSHSGWFVSRKCCQILAIAEQGVAGNRLLHSGNVESAVRKYVKRTMTYRDRLLVKRTVTHWDRLLVNGIATLSGHTPALKENIKAQVELDQLSLPDPDCSSVASSIAKARSELREVHCRLAAGVE